MGDGRQFVRSAGRAAAAAAIAALAACRDEPTRAVTPFAVEPSFSTAPVGVAGSILSPAPTFVVTNVDGKPLANVPVAIAISRGGGVLRNAPTRTAAGPTPLGEWTLDTVAGVNEVTILAAPAPAIRIAIAGLPGAPARITTGGRSGAPAGGVVTGLSVRVEDRFGNGVPSAALAFAVVAGGGDVTPSTATTNAAGWFDGVQWRLGNAGGTQRLDVASGAVHAAIEADIRSDFTPLVRFHGQLPSPEIQTAFRWAADRLRAAIIGDLGDVPVLNFDLSRCGVQEAALTETIDDVIMFAMVTPMDGAGRVLASAGPCIQRTQSRFPLIGVMRFDADDIAALAASGNLAPVVLHEMLHVLGVGSLWRDWLVGSGTSNPRFIGVRAGAECIAAGGLAYCGDGRVPVENTGGSGTAEVHWRESIFDRELMTGFIETTGAMPLSLVTLASLQDLGYAINGLGADPYRIEAAPVAARAVPAAGAAWEQLHLPLFEITPSGWIRPLRGR